MGISEARMRALERGTIITSDECCIQYTLHGVYQDNFSNDQVSCMLFAVVLWSDVG